MAETMKGTVILRSVPSREIGRKVAFYLATINRDMSSTDIATFLTQSKPLTIVEDVTLEKGLALAAAINGLGASACFHQSIKSSSRH